MITPRLSRPLRIAIVAGEASGDILGADLVTHLRQRFPDAEFEGLAGPRMQALGVSSLYPMERLSVMGILPILMRLPELLGVRRRLAKRWLTTPPDLFIGVDAPEFNLGLEQRLRAGGVRTVHYVSPSVWAWREKRIFRIARAVDLMLTLFPFELDIYQRHGIRAAHVGHPLADSLPLEPDQVQARRQLQLPATSKVLAVLPGSRGSELKLLAPVFLQVIQRLHARDPSLHFVLPCANEKRRMQLEAAIKDQQITAPLHILDGQSQTAMTAADAVLLASGTATLEAMLLKRPMVVAYRVGAISYAIFKRLLRIRRFALPNLLTGSDLVPELMQDDCTVDKLEQAVSEQLALTTKAREALQARFLEQHLALRLQAGKRAADAISALLTDEQNGGARR